MKKTAALMLVGALCGGAGVFFGRAPAMQALGLEGRDVDAVVVEERQDEGRLVLVLRADEDTFLASFRERAEDVASLVSVGDRVTMRTPRDGVFADDALILRVQRSEREPEPVDELLAANVEEVLEIGAEADLGSVAAVPGEESTAEGAASAPAPDAAGAAQVQNPRISAVPAVPAGPPPGPAPGTAPGTQPSTPTGPSAES